MTTKQWRDAWTKIAIAFETPPRLRDEMQGDITYWGLCTAFEVVAGSRLHIVIAMNVYRTGELRPKGTWLWFPDWNRRSDLLRATHAAFFAAMTPKEFEDICGTKLP